MLIMLMSFTLMQSPMGFCDLWDMQISTLMVVHISLAHVIIIAQTLTALVGRIMVEHQRTTRSQFCHRASFHHGDVTWNGEILLWTEVAHMILLARS